MARGPAKMSVNVQRVDAGSLNFRYKFYSTRPKGCQTVQWPCRRGPPSTTRGQGLSFLRTYSVIDFVLFLIFPAEKLNALVLKELEDACKKRLCNINLSGYIKFNLLHYKENRLDLFYLKIFQCN